MNDLGRLDRPIAQRVLIRLRWLAENFETITPEVLKGQWQGVFKLRIGNYRVLYTCDKAQQNITVHFVRHRLRGLQVKIEGWLTSFQPTALRARLKRVPLSGLRRWWCKKFCVKF